MISLIPKLPSASTFARERSTYQGPTVESNWVIKGKLIVGAYPGVAEDDYEHFSTLQSILNCKVTTFVCLQKEYKHTRQRTGKGSTSKRYGRIRPYIWDAYALCNSGNNRFIKASKLRMLHVPIKDCDTTEDEIVIEIATIICYRILMLREVVYLHCWGGHGRAGTIAAIVLGLLYGISADEALMRVQIYHDSRKINLGVPSPQTECQTNQVKRVLGRFTGVKLAQHKWWTDVAKNKVLQSSFVVPIEENVISEDEEKQSDFMSSNLPNLNKMASSLIA
mmetsp:Transcript_14901/g.17412  ORF Transcript_14901/g.17412 Transcript_14901/m.17412 type:complete len:279 (+) Transcript_14901:415-1251(+)